jgi:hypothetical protein
MKKYIFSLLALGIIAFPGALVFAANNTNVFDPSILAGPLISCQGFYPTSTMPGITLTNGYKSCTNLCDLIQTFENFVYFGIGIVIWIISPILFGWGGIMFMISRGQPNGISKAKSILTGGLIGLLITLCAWLIVDTVVTRLNIIGVGGFGTSGSCTPPAATQ